MKKPLIDKINSIHRDSIVRWKQEDPSLLKAPTLIEADFYRCVEENHAFNYQLWNAEDRARRDDLGAEHVKLQKRAIDGFNQQRNNRMESIDTWVFETLQPSDTCPKNSETPGAMIDRLSIMALKFHHMELQTLRTDVDQEHRDTCKGKLAVLKVQQEDLMECLDNFFEEIIHKTRTFRIYRQMKMYNDPKLNPQLYLHRL